MVNNLFMQKLVPVLFAAACMCCGAVLQACSGQQESVATQQQYLPNLGIDTLKLKAAYSECGEWGGHREMVKIYMSDKAKGTERDFMKWSGPLAAEFWLDTIGCSNRLDRRYFLVEQTELSRQQEALVMKYMQELIYLALKERYIMHGGNVYSVSSSNQRELNIRYVTSENSDSRFKLLSQQLFPFKK